MLLTLILIFLNSPFQAVIPDSFYSPSFIPEYDYGKGPEIYIDEAHNNLHTASGLYTTCANILRKDGYVIKPFIQKFSDETLNQSKVLVVSNAINERNIDKWEQPIYPAFDDKEIQCLKTWLTKGGSLFLIADHMPFSSASKNLAQMFGFKFYDGYATKRPDSISKKTSAWVDLFCRRNNMIVKNIITDGRDSDEYVDSIVTFCGQAFEIPDSATSILLFNNQYVQYTEKVHSQFDRNAKVENVSGFSQGAFMKYGKGRIVVFGEAAMFSGQLPAGLSFWKKIGLNAPEAKNNYKLLLNIVHWLDISKN